MPASLHFKTVTQMTVGVTVPLGIQCSLVSSRAERGIYADHYRSLASLGI